VEEFATAQGLLDILPLLKKGALVAQDPHNYEDIDGDEKLDETEIEVLRNEVLHKWRQPVALYFTIILCSIGAAVQGWDQTGSNGANLSFPQEFGIGGKDNHDALLVGLVNSGPYIGSAFFGCWISDPLNHYFGRRGTIFVAATFCFLSVIGSAFTQTWPQLFICRLLLGVGMGTKASTVPIYAAENSPASIRGALVMSWQVRLFNPLVTCLLPYFKKLIQLRCGLHLVFSWAFAQISPFTKLARLVGTFLIYLLILGS